LIPQQFRREVDDFLQVLLELEQLLAVWLGYQRSLNLRKKETQFT
jgi:hypothetical protein